MKKGKFIGFIQFKSRAYYNNHKMIAKICDFIFRVLFASDIPSSVKIGEGLVLPHLGLGVVIHPRAVIGNNCKIYQNVTIGCRNNEGPPIIGDNVLIGAGACILGKIKIGNNVSIGANAVIIHDIPDNSTAVGVLATIKQKDKKEIRA